MSYLVAMVALTVLIVIHELGHMWVARWCGMRVERFSVFFGPSLLRWRRRGTEFQIASIPFGGYVQIAGMNPQENLPEGDLGSYANKPAWQRFLTVLAGPAINYVFAIVLMLFITLTWGVPAPRVGINEVMPQSPAAAAGLRSGDIIVSIAGVPIQQQERVIELVTLSQGRPLRFQLERAGRPMQIDVMPRQESGVYRIGMRFAQRPGFLPASVSTAIRVSLHYPLLESAEVLGFFKKLFSRQVSPKQLGGPIEIVHQLKGSLDVGWVVLLLFAAKLSVLLGIFNLLPLPALDGGRLIFLGAEIITRRRVNQRFESIVHTVGFLLLLALIAFVTFGDIRRRLG